MGVSLGARPWAVVFSLVHDNNKGMTGQHASGLTSPLWRPFQAWSLALQYSLASLVVLLTSLLMLGWWVGKKIEEGVTHRVSAAAALYVENFIVKQLQGLPDKQWLTPTETTGLARLFSSTPFGQEVVRMKVWAPQGRIVYGDQVGATFKVGEDQALGLEGRGGFGDFRTQ